MVYCTCIRKYGGLCRIVRKYELKYYGSCLIVRKCGLKYGDGVTEILINLIGIGGCCSYCGYYLGLGVLYNAGVQ